MSPHAIPVRFSRHRVGLVSWDYQPHVGGMGRHVTQLEAGLRAAGCDVRVLSGLQLPISKRFGGHMLFSAWLMFQLRSWASNQRLDVVHVHTGPGGVLLPFRVRGVPLIVTAHHTYRQQSRVPGQFWKCLLIPFERRTYALADRVVCVSDDTRRVLQDHYRIPAGKLSVLREGFVLQPWHRADAGDLRTRLQCVFVGRADARKGWDLLRAAWPLIKKAVPDASLIAVGVPASKAFADMRCSGRLPDSELQKIVGESELLLCPSRAEGFGLAAAEAIVAGTPVVACDADGLRGVVSNGRTGLLTPFDAQAFADAVAGLLQDDQLRSRMRQQCRADSERFSIDACVTAHLGLYDEVYSAHT